MPQAGSAEPPRQDDMLFLSLERTHTYHSPVGQVPDLPLPEAGNLITPLGLPTERLMRFILLIALAASCRFEGLLAQTPGSPDPGGVLNQLTVASFSGSGR